MVRTMEKELIELEKLGNSIKGYNNCAVDLGRCLVPELHNIPAEMDHINKNAKLCWCIAVGPIITGPKVLVYGNTVKEVIALARKELMNIIEGIV